MVRSTKTRLSLSHQLARLYTTKLPTPTSTTTLQQCSIQSTYDSLLQTALALQHLIHVRLTVRAINQIDPPRLKQRTVNTGISIYQPRPTSTSRYDPPAASYDSTDLSFPLWSSSCILRLDRPQFPATIIQLHSTTQPTASRIKHLAVSPRFDLRQPPSSNIQLSTSTTRLTRYWHPPSNWRPNTTATDFPHTFVNLTINCHLCYICYLAFVSFIVFGCQLHALNWKHLRGWHAYRLCITNILEF